MDESIILSNSLLTVDQAVNATLQYAWMMKTRVVNSSGAHRDLLDLSHEPPWQISSTSTFLG